MFQSLHFLVLTRLCAALDGTFPTGSTCSGSHNESLLLGGSSDTHCKWLCFKKRQSQYPPAGEKALNHALPWTRLISCLKSLPDCGMLRGVFFFLFVWTFVIQHCHGQPAFPPVSKKHNKKRSKFLMRPTVLDVEDHWLECYFYPLSTLITEKRRWWLFCLSSLPTAPSDYQTWASWRRWLGIAERIVYKFMAFLDWLASGTETRWLLQHTHTHACRQAVPTHLISIPFLHLWTQTQPRQPAFSSSYI